MSIQQVTKPKRPTGAQRKQQIIEVILDLVAKHGVQATTTSRIAASAGVSEATLYRYFPSRHHMLLAALDLIYERIFRLIRCSTEQNAIERLRSIARFHISLLSNREEGFVYPLFEFVAAPPEIGLRKPLAQHQRSAIAALAAIVEEGKTQGVIRPEVDAEQTAWELVGVYWAVDVAYLMGLEDFVTSGRSVTMLERVLGAISTETSSA